MRGVLRRSLAVAALLLGASFSVLLVNAWRLPPPPPAPAVTPGPQLDLPAATARLAAALRIPTVSRDDATLASPEALIAFREHLAVSFPRVHSQLALERVAEHSLLYTWRGRRPDLPAVVLMAHQDVVPVEDAAAWTHPPFSGAVADGYVWGRGALDDKQAVLGILEACEALLAAGLVPERTVHLAFGHDEEVGGGNGARRIAERLASRGAQLGLVLDEGGFYAEDLMAGLPVPAALIGVAEKGYLSLELVAEADAGHSSRPPEEMAIGTLARALRRLQERPFPSRIDGATAGMLRALAPHMTFGRRLALANLWLLEPVVARSFAADPSSAAVVRTTTALTMAAAGHKDNVLPRHARAVVNFRILPGETVAGTIERAREIVDDPAVRMSPLRARGDGGDLGEASLVEPSTVSPVGSPGWNVVADAVRAAWRGGELAVAPYLLTGASDARFFLPLAEDVYRFTGYVVRPADVTRFHGLDERIAIEDYRRVIEVYWRVLRGLDRLDPAAPASPG
jgi:carboxypeptidase PM20D1